MNVLLFAEIAEIAGTRVVSVDVEEPVTIGKIKTKLAERFPDPRLKEKLRLCLGAVRETYCSDDTVLDRSVEEVALIPPVSGG
jgi:molybdopterin converting factor small subunit